MTPNDFSKIFETKPDEIVDPQRIYTVFSSDVLLAEEDRPGLIKQIKESAHVPSEHFKALYQTLIEQFSEFVQYLPKPIPRHPLWLDHHLRLASTALHLRNKYLIANTILEPQKERALWDYVTFSSILLSRIGQIVSDYKVHLCNDRGHFLEQWEPFGGTLLTQGNYYKIRQILPNLNENASDHLHVLIARQLMPVDGFHWIVTHPKAFQEWITTVIGDTRVGSPVSEMLALSEKQLQKLMKEKQEAELLASIAERRAREQAALEEKLLPLHGKLHDETELGENFLKWLKKGIEDGAISVNQSDSKVHMTEDGVFLLYPAIFQAFCHAYPRHPNWVAVYKQFNYLGLTPLGPDDYLFRKFFSDRPEVAQQKAQKEMVAKGLIVNDIKSIFGNKKPPAVTQEVTKANPSQENTLPNLRFQKTEKTTPKPSPKS